MCPKISCFRYIVFILTFLPSTIFGQEVADVFQFPVSNYLSSITQSFGEPNPNYDNKKHVAEDIRGIAGSTPIVAAANGKVMLARSWKICPNWGYILVVEHTLPDGSKVNSIYAHLDPDSIEINEGDNVRIGQQLGLVGRYSCWTDHLHFAIRAGTFGAPVGVYPTWLVGYLSKDEFSASYCEPSTFVRDSICLDSLPSPFPDELIVNEACIENLQLTVEGQNTNNGELTIGPSSNLGELVYIFEGNFNEKLIVLSIGTVSSFTQDNGVHIIFQCGFIDCQFNKPDPLPTGCDTNSFCGEDFLVTAPSSDIRHFSGNRGTEFDVLTNTEECGGID